MGHTACVESGNNDYPEKTDLSRHHCGAHGYPENRRRIGTSMLDNRVVQTENRRLKQYPTSRISGMKSMKSFFLLLICLTFIASVCPAEDFVIDGYKFTLPKGFVIEKATDASIVKRPISACFDQHGNLYVTESNGTNDPSQKQLADKPHWILKLSDSNHDGFFDKRTNYADRLMFPEGAMFRNGSLFVAAPPSIWKFSDLNNDGVSDHREEWFNAKTLTGCANDLHGPYLGPDGMIYWCKGAFAEQTYSRPGKTPLVTRASHIFRRHINGGDVESVMAGGMDNPVEVAFSEAGERFFTTTFLQHPANGKRDGIIHAIYGGVYGKDHGVLQGHPRTGELMPPLAHMGAAAPSGLMCMKSNLFGEQYRGNLFASSFNMHKITRHQLIRDGGSFKTIDEDFLVCDSFDFHPTDILEDSDGSLLVVDTGGWYKLCCPTSQLHKPEVLGGIYRIRRTGAPVVDDPWGVKIVWGDVSQTWVDRLGDERFAVANRAKQLLIDIGEDAIAFLRQGQLRLNELTHSQTATQIIWTASQINTPQAFEIVREGLSARSITTQIAAAHCVGLHRDKKAFKQLCQLLTSPSDAVRGAAIESLGRLRMQEAITPLMKTLKPNDGRILQHKVSYALIEIDDFSAVEKALNSANEFGVAAALIAMDQMESSQLAAEAVAKRINSRYRGIRQAAVWIALQHPQWATAFYEPMKTRLENKSAENGPRELKRLMSSFAQSATGSSTLALLLKEAENDAAISAVLQAMNDSKLKTPPAEWLDASRFLSHENPKIISLAVRLFEKLRVTDPQINQTLDADFLAAAQNLTLPDKTRLHAICVLRSPIVLDDDLFELSISNLLTGRNSENRTLATRSLHRAKLTDKQFVVLAKTLPKVGPLEIEQILALFRKTDSIDTANQLSKSLVQTSSLASVDRKKLNQQISHFGPELQSKIQTHFRRSDQTQMEKAKTLDRRLLRLPTGDAAKGQKIFQSSSASCSACHAVGYLGGRLGPDLTRIGGIRQKRDLMESILFPSLSFVRGYEPVIVDTIDGLTFNGFLKEDNQTEIILVTGDRKEIRIPRNDIEKMAQGTVSIMPAGLDQQLSDQELADLLEFLKTAR